MSAGWLLSRRELEALFDELATELDADGLFAEILMVGRPYAARIDDLLMKLYAGRATDHDDLVKLRPGSALSIAGGGHRGV